MRKGRRTAPFRILAKGGRRWSSLDVVSVRSLVQIQAFSRSGKVPCGELRIHGRWTLVFSEMD
jgi:hypothetical protein